MSSKALIPLRGPVSQWSWKKLVSSSKARRSRPRPWRRPQIEPLEELLLPNLLLSPGNLLPDWALVSEDAGETADIVIVNAETNSDTQPAAENEVGSI